MPRKMVTVEDRDIEEVVETSTPWGPENATWPSTWPVKGSTRSQVYESESDSERDRRLQCLMSRMEPTVRPEEGVTVTTIADIHEPRESERRGPTRSIIYLDIAAMTRENRFFVDVRVGPFTYKASGAQCCLAGPRMMRELAERIKPSMSLIGYANQQTQPAWWISPVMLQIDREAGRIDMECTEILPVEMVLGADFGRRWESRYIHGPKSVAFRGRAMAQFRPIERSKVNAMRHCGPNVLVYNKPLMDHYSVRRWSRTCSHTWMTLFLVTETFEEHVSWLERVIRILLDAKLVVNRDKCEFCCQSVQFLGYVLDSSGLRIDSERVRPIHDYPTPRNVKQVRRLLGMVGWYSRFIKNEAEIKVPLARLLRKDTPFVWGSDQEQAFATLKPSLSEAPVLVRPDFDKEFAIQTDASDYAIGAVLTQEREDGHLAAKKTYDRLACEYWWPGMWYAVEEYCNSCDVCQRYKVPQTGPKGLMTRRVVDRPWAVVAADMMEFPRSKNQNKYLLVFQDLFTRWIEIVPLRKANGVNVLRAFEELVLFRGETPEFLLTDNGKEFDNAVVNTALEEYGVNIFFYASVLSVRERSGAQ
ncbi:unnamed protein product [Trichogramma brassicae]|uniref:Integrase catalytic domain-containing protein n=1 Tax=Trichogramma brassicae TaxID=86971 RepID=A0A6H5JAX0_9HYME|nr:unnamed protein product [Trichogramma brassicae]